MTDLRDKVIWITGASGGIGEGLAQRAAVRGAKLVLSARREAELQRVRNALPDASRAAILPLDLLQFDAEQAAQHAASFFGPIDVLANNAGISQRTVALDTPMSSYRQIMELDFFAPVALTRALLPGWVERGAGHVVTVSSVFGKIAMARRTAYAAAKHALHGFHDCARIELEPAGVRFTVVCPGAVATNVARNALGTDGKPVGRADAFIDSGMGPADCAEQIWRAVERNKLEVVIAGKEHIAVWFKRFLPLSWYTAFARRLKVN